MQYEILQQDNKKIYKSFSDGQIVRTMNIHLPYILLTLYLDAFASNNAIGSSNNKNKLMGFYYNASDDIKVCARQSTIQLLALLDNKDISEFGLSKCLKIPIEDLKNLVESGFYDKELDTTLEVRVIACLGDNLEQNQECTSVTLYQ